MSYINACSRSKSGKHVKHPYAYAPSDGEVGDPMCEFCQKKIHAFKLIKTTPLSKEVVSSGSWHECVSLALKMPSTAYKLYIEVE